MVISFAPAAREEELFNPKCTSYPSPFFKVVGCQIAFQKSHICHTFYRDSECQSTRVDLHGFRSIHSPVRPSHCLTCMSLGHRRKPQYPERTNADWASLGSSGAEC